MRFNLSIIFTKQFFSNYSVFLGSYNKQLSIFFLDLNVILQISRLCALESILVSLEIISTIFFELFVLSKMIIDEEFQILVNSDPNPNDCVHPHPNPLF